MHHECFSSFSSTKYHYHISIIYESHVYGLSYAYRDVGDMVRAVVASSWKAEALWTVTRTGAATTDALCTGHDSLNS